MQNKVLILDFGSQYTQLIGRRVRELNIFSEIKPFNNPPKDLSEYKAVILSGSPYSVRAEDAPHPDLSEIRGKKPLLGVCYGAQYLAHFNGGNVEKSNTREYGRANLSTVETGNPFLKNVNIGSQVWMSHADTIKKLPENAQLLASTHDVENAAFKFEGEETYGIQFHPEVYHSTDGKQLLENFLVDIAGIEQTWTPDAFVETTVAELQEKIGDEKVILGLSGGVDSSVAAVLLHKAIGKNLHCIFVNNGLLRKNEFEQVQKLYKELDLNVMAVDATKEFITELEGVSDPETKRKIIGRVFIDIFKNSIKELGDIHFLAQGTLYPDVIESVSPRGESVTIKSHHNVGGLPKDLNLKLVEPLRELFKDEVRRIGEHLGIPRKFLWRHPFPGPGLAIRLIGEINADDLDTLRESDDIFTNELKKNNLYDDIWQAFCVLLPVRTVGVQGDARSYEKVLAIRAVTSKDGMTADWFDFDGKFMRKLSNRITNEVKGVNRVVYDVTSKPPGTIEWE